MSEAHVYPVKENIKNHTHADNDTYLAMYQQSVSDPEGFWSEYGKVVDWIKPFTQVKNTSFNTGHVDIRWFEDGTLNVSANCIDRHLAERGDDLAGMRAAQRAQQRRKVRLVSVRLVAC